MAKRTKRVARIDAEAPTPEQMTRDVFVIERESVKGQIAAPHYRKMRQLEQLSAQGLFTARQAKALANYRAAADMADRSPLRDSLAMMEPRGGTGDGPGLAVLRATQMARDVERASGSLSGLLRAVIVDDISLNDYAMVNYGKRQNCQTVGDKTVCYDRPTDKAMEFARLDMRMLAMRVESELTA